MVFLLLINSATLAYHCYRLVVGNTWFYLFACRNTQVGFNGLWYKGHTSVYCCVDSWTVNIAVIYHCRLLYFYYSKRESLWKFSDIVSLVACIQLFWLRGRLQNTSYCGGRTDTSTYHFREQKLQISSKGRSV